MSFFKQRKTVGDQDARFRKLFSAENHFSPFPNLVTQEEQFEWLLSKFFYVRNQFFLRPRFMADVVNSSTSSVS